MSKCFHSLNQISAECLCVSQRRECRSRSPDSVGSFCPSSFRRRTPDIVLVSRVTLVSVNILGERVNTPQRSCSSGGLNTPDFLLRPSCRIGSELVGNKQKRGVWLPWCPVCVVMSLRVKRETGLFTVQGAPDANMPVVHKMSRFNGSQYSE